MAAKKKGQSKKKASATKKSGPAKDGAGVMKADALGAIIGVKVVKPLEAQAINKMLKGLPGFPAQLDNVADKLDESDEVTVKGVTSARLRDVQEEREKVLAREQVLYRVWRAARDKRLQLDHEAMDALFRLTRRVDALSEDNPELLDEWKFLIDFMKSFRRSGKADDEEAPPEA